MEFHSLLSQPPTQSSQTCSSWIPPNIPSSPEGSTRAGPSPGGSWHGRVPEIPSHQESSSSFSLGNPRARSQRPAPAGSAQLSVMIQFQSFFWPQDNSRALPCHLSSQQKAEEFLVPSQPWDFPHPAAPASRRARESLGANSQFPASAAGSGMAAQGMAAHIPSPAVWTARNRPRACWERGNMGMGNIIYPSSLP